ncbi:MAG: hypothetical protein OHK0029_28150 [Armatimonadaceae bacterium]
MGYALHRVEAFGEPFQVVHEQIVLVPASGYQATSNTVRKLIFVLGGECRHRVVGWEGRWHDVLLRPGDILSVPCVCEQQYVTPEPGRPGRLHVIRLAFDPAFVPVLPQIALGEPDSIPESDPPGLSALAEISLRQIVLLRGAAQETVFQETLTQLREEARTCPPGYRLRVHSLCTSLLVLTARWLVHMASPDRVVPSHPATIPTPEYHVKHIKDFLRAHIGQPLRLHEVAAHVGLSEEHTARLFKKATGLTVLEYARWLRITEAKSLLAMTEKNLSQIAFATGFASLTVFSRNFKAQTGLSPSEFRRRIASEMG